jgi:transposase
MPTPRARSAPTCEPAGSAASFQNRPQDPLQAPRCTQRTASHHDRNAYPGRNVIERAFNGFKHWRGHATAVRHASSSSLSAPIAPVGVGTRVAWSSSTRSASTSSFACTSTRRTVSPSGKSGINAVSGGEEGVFREWETRISRRLPTVGRYQSFSSPPSEWKRPPLALQRHKRSVTACEEAENRGESRACAHCCQRRLKIDPLATVEY